MYSAPLCIYLPNTVPSYSFHGWQSTHWRKRGCLTTITSSTFICTLPLWYHSKCCAYWWGMGSNHTLPSLPPFSVLKEMMWFIKLDLKLSLRTAAYIQVVILNYKQTFFCHYIYYRWNYDASLGTALCMRACEMVTWFCFGSVQMRARNRLRTNCTFNTWDKTSFNKITDVESGERFCLEWLRYSNYHCLEWQSVQMQWKSTAFPLPQKENRICNIYSSLLDLLYVKIWRLNTMQNSTFHLWVGAVL